MRLMKKALPAAVGLALGAPTLALAESHNMETELEALKDRIEQLESQLEETKKQQEATEEKVAKATSDSGSGIDVGGAVRVNYSNKDWNDSNDRGGDLKLDTFRFNVDGEIGDVILSGEFRHYDYMDVVHHAWVGYDFNEMWQGQLGINQVPFGVTPYNSHNFYFSSNYYLGLEDDYDAGIKFIRDSGPLNLQFAFYKNDEEPGANDKYSADPISEYGGDGAIRENNTFNGRVAYTLGQGTDFSTELGASVQAGDLSDGSDSVGDHTAYAAHLVGNYKRWNVQLQATDYEYDLDSGADALNFGYFAFNTPVAAEATSYTANVAYSLPVSFGPVSNLTFYNDYSLITDKTGDYEDTMMNVTGMAITAGGVYAYLDYIQGENQPFVGGQIAGNSDESNSLINLNVGYYF